MKTIRIALSLISATLLLPSITVHGLPAPGAEPAEVGQSHFAAFGTNRVHYVTLGNGKSNLVFIHGWGGNTHFWKEQMSATRDRAKVVIVDLPGHGQSSKPLLDYTMDYYARSVLEVMRDAHMDQATVIGHSMGVVVICRLHAMAPQKIAGLVAVDGLLRRPNITPEQAEQFIAAYRTPEYRTQVTNFIGAMFPNPGTEALRSWTLAEVLTTPQPVLSSSMDSMFKLNQPAWDLEKVAVPLLVINTTSPMWTTEYRAYVRGLSTRSDYREIDGTGHFLMLEKPKAFNEALIDLLSKYRLIDPPR